MPSKVQVLIKTQVEDSIMTGQAGTQKEIKQSRSSETADLHFINKDQSIPTQMSLVSSSDEEAKDIIMTEEADAQEGVQGTPSGDSDDVQMISKDEFINRNHNLIPKPTKEKQRISKRIKKQQSRTAKITTQADLDGEALVNAQPDLQVCRNGLKDHRTKLQNVIVQLKSSQRELRTCIIQLSPAENDCQKIRQVQQELASVRRELKASQDNLRRTQNTFEELQETRRKLAASQDELTACKDDLFRLQPIVQTPDSRLVKEFENLCQQIVNWIETEVAMFEKSHSEDGPEHILSIGEDKEAAKFMSQHPRGGEYLAAYMIHRWLQDHLFGQKLSCLGLPAEAIQLLERAEHSMARLDPPRDSTTIVAWRSETLKALASTEECEKTRMGETQDMSSRLFKDLSKTLPVLFTRRETYSSFHTRILRPAVNLAVTIQESSARYAWSVTKSIPRKSKPISKAVFENYKIVDVMTGKCLEPDNLVVADQQGIIGAAVLMVEPGLYRAIGDRQWHTLRKRTIMVNLKFPLGKHKRPSA